MLPFIDALFLDRSILSFDTRAFPPFFVEASADLATRPGNFVTSDLNGWIVPEARFTLSELLAGRAPLWNPSSLCGQPLLANLAYPAYYPPNWLGLVSAENPLRPIAWLVVLHLALAGIGAFYFLRGHGVSILPACFGGIGVELSTWLTTHAHLPTIVATASWFFWILIAVDRVLAFPNRRAAVWLALAVGAAALAGFPQLLAIELLGAGVYAGCRLLERGRVRRVESAGSGLLGVALGVVLGAIHLLPAVDLLRDSLRSSFVTADLQSSKAMEPAAFFGLVLPDFFPPAVVAHTREVVREDDYAQRRWLGLDWQENPVENALAPGAVVLLVLLVGGMRRRSKPVLAIYALAGIALVLGVESPLLTWLHSTFPSLSAASPKRVLLLFVFTLPILAAFGLEGWKSRGWGRLETITLAIGVIFGVGGAVAWTIDGANAPIDRFLDRIGRDAWILAAAAIVLVLLKKLSPRIGSSTAVVAVVLLATLELGWRARAFNPTQDLRGQYPSTPAIEFLKSRESRSVRFENIEGAAASLGSYFGFRSFDGAQPMVTTRFGELVESIEPGRFDRGDPRVMRPFTRTESLSHPSFLRGASSDVVVTREVPELGLPVIYGNESEGLGVYEQSKALPRVRLVGGYEVVPTMEERLRRLADESLDPRTTVLLEEELGAEFTRGAAQATGTARIVEESATSLSIELSEITTGVLLFVADSFAPGWTAEIDGRETPVLAGDHAFRAVAIPAGSKRVVMRYEPRSFILGATGSVIALIAMMLLGRGAGERSRR